MRGSDVERNDLRLLNRLWRRERRRGMECIIFVTFDNGNLY